MNNLSIILVLIAIAFGYSSSECIKDPLIPNLSGIGGSIQRNPDDADVLDKAKQVVRMWNWIEGRRYSMNFMKLECLKRAESQVVAGRLWRFTVQLAQTDCFDYVLLLPIIVDPSGLTWAEFDRCNAVANGRQLTCQLEALDNFVTKKTVLLSSKCE
jgi:hypothetical protein